MKNTLLTLIAVLLAGCATTPEQKLLGEYEWTTVLPNGTKYSYKRVLLDNGICERQASNSNVRDRTRRWSIVDGEIHIVNESAYAGHPNGGIIIYRVNKDKSITPIADINKDGKREEREMSKEEYQGSTWKKIK